MLQVTDQLTLRLSCEHGSATLGCIKCGDSVESMSKH